jgi:hypothetical protein
MQDDVKTELIDLVWDKLKENLLTTSAASGIETARVTQRFFSRNVGTCAEMLREKFKQRPCKNESTDASYRDRPVHSSVEAPVMGVERKNRLIQ